MKKRIAMLAGMASVLAIVATSVTAQQRLSEECRTQLRDLCDMQDRRERRACLREKSRELTAECRSELRALSRGQQGAARAGTMTVPATQLLSFGEHQRQGVDYYAPTSPSAEKSPLILFVHGGGWAIGSRERTVHAKPAHFTANGYAFGSLGYRLLPEAPVETQAADVAAGIAYMRGQADRLGFDPDRIILMGHSAGAHLAALVATDPQYAGEDMAAIQGVVLLDGAGYDVAANMARATNRASQMYQDAFGNDPERQSALSPITYAGAPDAPHWLILHVSWRAGSRDQSQALGAALTQAGSDVSVEAVRGTDHGRMNRELGTQGDTSTALVDAFLARVFE